MDDRTRRLERAAVQEPGLAPQLARAYARGGDFPAAWRTHKNWLEVELGAAEHAVALQDSRGEDEPFDEPAWLLAHRQLSATEADLASMTRLDQTGEGSYVRKMSMVEVTGGIPKFANAKHLPVVPVRWDDAGVHEEEVHFEATMDEEGWTGSRIVGRKKARRGDVGVVIWVGESQFGTKVGVKVLRFAVLDQEDVKAGRYRKLFGKKVPGSNRFAKLADGSGIEFERKLPDDPVFFTSIANVELLERPADAWMWGTFQRDAQVKEQIRQADIKKGDWVDVEHEGAVTCGKVFWAGAGKDGVFTVGIQPKGTKGDRSKIRFLPGIGARKLPGPCFCRFKEGRQVATCKAHKQLNPTTKEG